MRHQLHRSSIYILFLAVPPNSVQISGELISSRISIGSGARIFSKFLVYPNISSPQQSLQTQSKSMENSFLQESQMLQERESLSEQRRRFYQEKANFEEERRKFTEAAIQLGKEVGVILLFVLWRDFEAWDWCWKGIKKNLTDTEHCKFLGEICKLCFWYCTDADSLWLFEIWRWTVGNKELRWKALNLFHSVFRRKNSWTSFL